jgi:hypothetical protein
VGNAFKRYTHKNPPQSNIVVVKLTSITAIDYITQLESQNSKYRAELDRVTSQHAEMEHRMKTLEQQLQRANGASAHDAYASPPNAISPMFSGSHSEVPRTLPPLVNGAMQGVQYDDRR